MEQHKGAIVEAAIKKSGLRMTVLADKLGIARNTLYTRLKSAEIKDAFIIKIGNIIHYDFSNEFPDIYEKNANQTKDTASGYTPKGDTSLYGDEWNDKIKDPYDLRLQKLNKKYIHLMEDYNKLLKVLILLEKDNVPMALKQEILGFVKNEEPEN